jgi:hypothetical protein
MKKEFDGPSFVNPQHTSFGLTNGQGYQKPNITFTPQNKAADTQIAADRKKGIPRGGIIIITQVGTMTNQSHKQIPRKPASNLLKIFLKMSHLKKHRNRIHNTYPIINLIGMPRIPKNYKIRPFLGNFNLIAREYEVKIIDDVLNAKGVTLKPAETQMKEFIKRLKTLNKDIVCDIFNEKLLKFDEMGDGDKIRVLVVSLFII